MNEFISKYIDLMALALTLIVPLLITIQLKRKRGRTLRAAPLYLFVFGPSGILSFIFFHLFENIYRGIIAFMAGTFQYNFRFYSLILLGVVVGYVGFRLLKACRRYCLNSEKPNRDYFIQFSLILLFTLPLIPIIPIAAVPLVCCVISLLGFPFVHRKVKQMPVVLQEEVFALTA